ncbi:large ribosomal subunit protein bL34m [Diachasmimorpha longicaudata]|uniref:large ribosomal subunit protein bL34m n=1 Tax=Diachasmimorpha longicaudata TaxID=58733 RepID=UPI0030B8D4B7
MFGRLMSTVLQTVHRSMVLPTRSLCMKPPVKLPLTPYEIAGGRWGTMPFLHQVRNNWPRPKETKRIKTHGYAKRMSTLAGRKIIMRRILKGCSILSH